LRLIAFKYLLCPATMTKAIVRSSSYLRSPSKGLSAMPLELVPELGELSIDQLESKLEAVRVQRLLLRIQYQQAANIRLAALGRRTRDRLKHQLEMFVKEFQSLENALNKCDRRMEQITIVKNEVSYIEDALDEDIS
jgi:hypothetical protein